MTCTVQYYSLPQTVTILGFVTEGHTGRLASTKLRSNFAGESWGIRGTPPVGTIKAGPIPSSMPRQTLLSNLPFNSMANNVRVVPVVNPGSENDSPSKGTSRLRSRVACRACNHRKVRCDVTRTGIPCSNCVHETATCEVLPRKKHR